MFKCTECNAEFYAPDEYEETHGLDCGPYERVGICPKCKSTDYKEWDNHVEKIDVASVLISTLVNLNRLSNQIADVFGPSFKNEELEFAREMCAEYIEEMYDEFMPCRLSNKMRQAVTTSDAQRIIEWLEG
jgi:hypothetical protein